MCRILAQNPYISENKENQDEVTQVSPSYVRNGVLRVSIIQLRRCSDKENLAEILTLTSEVRLSDKTLFFNRSLVHSSARDQLRNYHQYGFISEDTIVGADFALPSKILLDFQKIFKTVSLPMTPISGMFGPL